MMKRKRVTLKVTTKLTQQRISQLSPLEPTKQINPHALRVSESMTYYHSELHLHS